MTRKQSTSKLPLIMLSIVNATTTMQLVISVCLLSALWAAMGVQSVYLSDFVTARKTPNWTWAEFGDADHLNEPERSIAASRRSAEASYLGYEGRYNLRFRPLQPMPRLLWHKFPQQQQQQEPLPTAVPAEPIPIETTPEPESETEASTESAVIVTEAPATTAPPTTPAVTEAPLSPPTEVMITTMSTNMRPPLKLSTTSTTIMKPPNHYTPQLGNSLKNFLLFGSPVEANLIKKHSNAPKTKSKGFLGLFEVIKFENNKCSVAMGDIRSMEGICYHEFECKSLGGIITERCAEGVGVCCIFLTGCGEVTNQPVAYFESPNYPQPVRETIICVLIVNLRKNVQQLRLDFLMFELSRPTNGDCIDDQFIVSGQNMNFIVPVLCGINTGQHVYLHVDKSVEKKVYLSIFAKVPAGGRSFNIKITQLENDLAPDNCLQYYTETEGVVKSFNYDTDGSVVDNREATYLNNLNYAICMARAAETCTVTYYTEQQGGDLLDFQITNKDEAENDLVPDGQAGAGIFNCPDDFIAINQVRLCGERFNDGTENEDFTVNAIVKDVAAGPIILPFRSDSEYVGRGFRLVYKQELCI